MLISLIPKISEELHTYVQPIITHFLATWPWKSNIRLDEIAASHGKIPTGQRNMAYSSKWEMTILEIQTRDIHTPPPRPPILVQHSNKLMNSFV